jgi:pheromone shutdown-related protein TraB
LEESEKRLIIIGTAHVSPKSVEDVKNIIKNEKPDAVAVELCPRRYKALVEGFREDIPVTELIRRGDTFLFLFQLLLSHFQKKVGEEYGIKPGAEMLAAVEKAREIGADVLLIDRDVGITFRRFWSSLGFFGKVRMLWYFLRSMFSGEDVDVDELLKQDILDALVKEFRKISPSAAKILIDERDEYMAANLLVAMQRYSKIVAVVGAGHRKGIERALKKFEKERPNLSALETVEKGRNWFKIIGAGFAIFILFVFIMLAVTVSTQVLITALAYWFLINGVLAALGAAIARGHPLSVLAAFLFAWLTSLNPLVAAGWVSGAVEAWIRKPRASDLGALMEANNLREMMENRFFRVLAVAALTNIGSMIGTIYGGYYITTRFGVDVAKIISEKLFTLFG